MQSKHRNARLRDCEQLSKEIRRIRRDNVRNEHKTSSKHNQNMFSIKKNLVIKRTRYLPLFSYCFIELYISCFCCKCQYVRNVDTLSSSKGINLMISQWSKYLKVSR